MYRKKLPLFQLSNPQLTLKSDSFCNSLGWSELSYLGNLHKKTPRVKTLYYNGQQCYTCALGPRDPWLKRQRDFN